MGGVIQGVYGGKYEDIGYMVQDQGIGMGLDF